MVSVRCNQTKRTETCKASELLSLTDDPIVIKILTTGDQVAFTGRDGKTYSATFSCFKDGKLVHYHDTLSMHAGPDDLSLQSGICTFNYTSTT